MLNTATTPARARAYVRSFPRRPMIDALPHLLKTLIERFETEGHTNDVRRLLNIVRAGLDELVVEVHSLPKR